MLSSHKYVGPVGEFLIEKELSTYKVAAMIGLSQVTVWRHATGHARIEIDALDAYTSLGISLKKLKEWNNYLKVKRGLPDGKNNKAQGGNSGPSSL